MRHGDVTAICRKTGVPVGTAHQRIRRGWDVLRACTERPRPYFREREPTYQRKETGK